MAIGHCHTGIGRTGRMLGYEHDAVTPDVMTLGKGLGGGFPIAAFLCTEAAARTVSLGGRVEARLRAFAAARPDRVADVRGKGLLLGMELRDADRAATLALRALDRGILINVAEGTVLRLFPALNIPEGDLFPALDTVLALMADWPDVFTNRVRGASGWRGGRGAPRRGAERLSGWRVPSASAEAGVRSSRRATRWLPGRGSPGHEECALEVELRIPCRRA